MLSACAALRLNCTLFDYRHAHRPQHARFLQWAAEAITRGDPVALGLYWGVEQDSDYDHIVPMVGFERAGEHTRQ